MKLLLLTGESGSGKTTIASRLGDDERFNLIKSFTSRKPRKNCFEDHEFRSKTQLGHMMAHMPYVASTLIDDELYVAFENQFNKNKINVYVVDELGLLDVINHKWWENGVVIHHSNILKIKIINPQNNISKERRKRYGLFLDDCEYDKIIVNENIDETVSKIKEVIL